MSDWRWLAPHIVYAIHDRQVSEHGGGQGVRDRNAIESALARPLNLIAYGEADPAALAAAYAYGLARDHGFADGNKRVAWVAARLFLADNGCKLVFGKLDAIRLMEGLASGVVSEEDLADWFRKCLQP